MQPCSQFCVEPEASVVDASAVWHGAASVPGGRFWNRPPGTEAVPCQTADASTTLAAGSTQN